MSRDLDAFRKQNEDLNYRFLKQRETYEETARALKER